MWTLPRTAPHDPVEVRSGVSLSPLIQRFDSSICGKVDTRKNPRLCSVSGFSFFSPMREGAGDQGFGLVKRGHAAEKWIRFRGSRGKTPVDLSSVGTTGNSVVAVLQVPFSEADVHRDANDRYRKAGFRDPSCQTPA